MAEQHIKVNPDSIKGYGSKAQSHFNEIRANLQHMANEIDRVPYEGTNAEKFKGDVGLMMSEFSTAMLKDLGAIANAVKTTTSNIAQALGGQAVNISVDGRAIIPQPVKKGDGTQAADTVALGALPTTLKAKFESINTELNNHVKNLQATIWEGKGKKDCVELVSGYTKTATKDCDDAKASIIAFIKAQLVAVEAADVVRSTLGALGG